MNACQDSLKIYRSELSGQRGTTNILAPSNLKLLPLYILALLKFVSISFSMLTVFDMMDFEYVLTSHPYYVMNLTVIAQSAVPFLLISLSILVFNQDSG